MKEIIRIENLQKSFGAIKAVNNLSFRVKEGELFAFLGVNGAGKSTTINIMCGQLSKDSGKVFIDDLDLETDLNEIKTKLGVVFQNSVLDSSLSVYDNLESRAALYGIVGNDFQKRLKELSALLEFESILRRPVGKLSGGQRRRIDIARSLLNNPKILILDEPTTGLDPPVVKIETTKKCKYFLKRFRNRKRPPYLVNILTLYSGLSLCSVIQSVSSGLPCQSFL